MWQRLVDNWVYGALPLAFVLAGLSPFLDDSIALPVFLSLPVYMLHQYEEHDADRFRTEVNAMLGAGRVGLSRQDVWMVNVVLVWFLLLAVFFLARSMPAWGVIAGYLMAINAVVHILPALIRRWANPGLWTALVLFLPLSAWIFRTVEAPVPIHVVSALLIIALHAGIFRRAARSSDRGAAT